jgi:ABC-type amino acid transport system permease subunit
LVLFRYFYWRFFAAVDLLFGFLLTDASVLIAYAICFLFGLWYAGKRAAGRVYQNKPLLWVAARYVLYINGLTGLVSLIVYSTVFFNAPGLPPALRDKLYALAVSQWELLKGIAADVLFSYPIGLFVCFLIARYVKARRERENTQHNMAEG